MNRTSLRAEPVSIHLARQRDCLERQGAQRRLLPTNPSDRDLSRFDWHRQPFAMLPFERQDDDD
jgi:hypothetical protein